MADAYNTELAMIVEAGTIATLREIPSGRLVDYAYEYRQTGNDFMLGMVAKAATANMAELARANTAPLPKDSTRRRVFGQKIDRIYARNGLSQIVQFAVGDTDQLPYEF